MAESGYTLPRPDFDRPLKLLIVCAPFYRDIADALLVGARAELDAAGAAHETVEVPGALEIPQAIRIAHRQSHFDGFVALGCVIRGETSHYESVCTESARGISLLGLEGASIGNGILTVENHAQAVVRSDPAQGDKGGGAAAAALHLIALSRRFGREDRGMGFRPPPGSFDIA
jgi:6,7-dimethyl-8-ribityllumazine synthase